MLAKLKEITKRGKGKIIVFDIMGSERRLDELIMKSILSSYTDLSSGIGGGKREEGGAREVRKCIDFFLFFFWKIFRILLFED